MSLTVPGVTIYGIRDNGQLCWYSHRGYKQGNQDWANRGLPVAVGTGWNEGRFVFKGGLRGNGVIYRINSKHDLLWYRHHGYMGDELQSWTGGIKVGEGWQDARSVFSGGDGVIYMVNSAGDLLWYRHEGHLDGRAQWARTSKVGEGWNTARKVFSGGNGIIYLVEKSGDLYWYKHLGFHNGAPQWEPRKKVGNGWDIAPDIFSGGDGRIYTVRHGGGMYWYRHTGANNGDASWEAGGGRMIGSGWLPFVRIF